MAARDGEGVGGDDRQQDRLPGDREGEPALERPPLLGGLGPAQAGQQKSDVGQVLSGEAAYEDGGSGGEEAQARAA